METKLFNTSPVRRRLAASLGVLATATAVAVLGPALVQARDASIATAPTGATVSGGTGSTTTAPEPNDYTCTGSLAPGAKESGVPGTQVLYSFSCNGPITGYQIETEPHQVQYYDASPLLTIDGSASTVPGADGFECEGAIPGVAIDCVTATGLDGTSTASEQISGQFTINGPLWKEPRLDAILTVTDAIPAATATATATPVTVKAFGSTGSTTVTSKVTATVSSTSVTQYISGPFDLGRPKYEYKDAFDHDTRLGSNPPVVVLTGKTKNGDVVTTPEPKAGPPAKPKPKK
jgi:hypothetical protein